MRNITDAAAELDQALQFEDDAYRYRGQGPEAKAVQPVGTLPDIVAMLHSEHRYMHALLDILEQQVEKLQPGRIADYPLMLDVVDYLSRYPDQYHHPREDLLFASLARNDTAFLPYQKRLGVSTAQSRRITSSCTANCAASLPDGGYSNTSCDKRCSATSAAIATI